ncbi:energy transducer TonB [Providencia rettgeri]|uniref:energy transducer TonB n=1 Tax=Providencia rettgeri TaxID=587 RepID=UPI0034E0760D
MKIKLTPLLLLLLTFLFVASALPLFFGYGLFIALYELGELIWPSALNVSDNLFLTVMWLFGSAFVVALLIGAVRFKARQYWGIIIVVLAVFSTITLINIPLNEASNQRWRAQTLIEQHDWSSFLNEQNTAVNDVLSGIIDNRETDVEVEARYHELQARVDKMDKLVELAPQSAAMRAIWQPLLQANTPASKDQITQLEDASQYLPQDGALAYAVGLLKLRQADPLSLKDSLVFFFRAVVAEPNNPAYWQGLGVAYSLIKNQADNSDVNLKKAYAAFIFAQYLSLTNQWSTPPSSLFDTQSAAILAKEIQRLSTTERQNVFILQARSKIKVLDWRRETVDAQTQLLAKQPLSVQGSYGAVRLANDYYRGDPRYPGKMTINTEGTSIVPSSVNGVRYPSIKYDVDNVTATVSVDVNEKGTPAFTLIETTSGIKHYDIAAEYAVSQLRFEPVRQPVRHLVTVSFKSTVKSLDDYAKEVGLLVERASKALARHNEKSFEHVIKRLVSYVNNTVPAKYTRTSRSSYEYYQQQQEISKEIRATLRQADSRSKSNGEAWESNTQRVRALLLKHPNNLEVLSTTARMELMHFNAARNLLTKDKASAIKDGFVDNEQHWRDLLLSARGHYLQIITINPNRIDAWFAWGVTMIDEDPELAAGAFALMHYNADNSIDQRLMVAQSRFFLFGLPDKTKERVNIINARMAQLYSKGEIPVSATEEERQAFEEQKVLAQKVMPAAIPFVSTYRIAPMRNENLADPMAVSIDAAAFGIQENTLKLPAISQESVGKTQGEAVLKIDVPKGGVPSSVMLQQSSGVDYFDDNLISAAYQWRFNSAFQNKVLLIPVTFSQPSESSLNGKP